MSAQHTPGPWHLDRYGDVVDIDGRTIRANGLALTGSAEGIANSKLIAAAPELLAALGAMLTHMGMDEDDWNKPTFEQARAAVSKATGSTS